MNCTGVESRNARYLPTIIGSHMPPNVFVSHVATAIGTLSMNGGTMEMRNAGTASTSAKMNMLRSARKKRSCSSRCAAPRSANDAVSTLSVAW